MQKTNGKKPLHRATTYGHTQIYEFLLQNGADIDAKNKNEKAPLHRAARADQTKTCELLIPLSKSFDLNPLKDNTEIKEEIRGIIKTELSLRRNKALQKVKNSEPVIPL